MREGHEVQIVLLFVIAQHFEMQRCVYRAFKLLPAWAEASNAILRAGSVQDGKLTGHNLGESIQRV